MSSLFPERLHRRVEKTSDRDAELRERFSVIRSNLPRQILKRFKCYATLKKKYDRDVIQGSTDKALSIKIYRIRGGKSLNAYGGAYRFSAVVKLNIVH